MLPSQVVLVNEYSECRKLHNRLMLFWNFLKRIVKSAKPISNGMTECPCKFRKLEALGLCIFCLTQHFV